MPYNASQAIALPPAPYDPADPGSVALWSDCLSKYLSKPAYGFPDYYFDNPPGVEALAARRADLLLIRSLLAKKKAHRHQFHYRLLAHEECRLLEYYVKILGSDNSLRPKDRQALLVFASQAVEPTDSGHDRHLASTLALQIWRLLPASSSLQPSSPSVQRLHSYLKTYQSTDTFLASRLAAVLSGFQLLRPQEIILCFTATDCQEFAKNITRSAPEGPLQLSGLLYQMHDAIAAEPNPPAILDAVHTGFFEGLSLRPLPLPKACQVALLAHPDRAVRTHALLSLKSRFSQVGPSQTAI